MGILTIIGLLYLIGFGLIADACRRAPFIPTEGEDHAS